MPPSFWDQVRFLLLGKANQRGRFGQTGEPVVLPDLNALAAELIFLLFNYSESIPQNNLSYRP